MIAAVIPTRYHPPQLATLLQVLEGDEVTPFVLESDDHDHRIYDMWNQGTRMARALGALHIAVLNDDVELQPGTLPTMARLLDERPDVGVVYPDINAAWETRQPVTLEPTVGTWGAGGMTGFAFMFRAGLAVRFDETWGLWYGDDAFEADVRASGLLVCRAVGIPVRHHPMGSTSRDMGHWAPIIAADRARWDARA